MSKAVDAGKTFMEAVFAKIPEAHRAAVVAAFTDPAAADALTVIGTGALAQSDINRQYDELAAQKTQVAEDFRRNSEWWETNKERLTELDALKRDPRLAASAKPPAADPNAPPPIDPAKFVSRDDFTKTMQQEQMAAANYLALQNVLTLQHFQNFNEILDTRELLVDKRLGTVVDGKVFGLVDAYQAKFSDRLTEREQKLEADRISKLVDAQVAERMKSMPNLPFPTRNTGVSPLDALEATTEQKGEYTAAAAAEMYDRLVNART